MTLSIVWLCCHSIHYFLSRIWLPRIVFVTGTYYAPAPNRRGIKRCFCVTSVWRLSVCLSRTSGLSREQRGLGKPKLAQRYPTSHVTRTLLSRWKGQRSRSPGHFAHRRVGKSGGWSGGRENVLAVGNCCSAAEGSSAPAGAGEGRGIPWRLQLGIVRETLPHRGRRTRLILCGRQIDLEIIKRSQQRLRRVSTRVGKWTHNNHRKRLDEGTDVLQTLPPRAIQQSLHRPPSPLPCALLQSVSWTNLQAYRPPCVCANRWSLCSSRLAEPTVLADSSVVTTIQVDFDSTSVRRPSDCLWKVIKVTMTSPVSRSHADL